MLRRLIIIAALLLAAARADALEYTDVYYNPQESGWGVFLVQSDTTQFIAMFIYGPDGKPTWYVATLIDDGTGNYKGGLVATTGTYFANPWQGVSGAQVGTASFKPIDGYHATLTYALTGGQPVIKAVERQTLAPYVLAGNYTGAMSGTQSGCTDPNDNDAHVRGTYDLAVTQTGDTSATLVFTFTDAADQGAVCTVTGPLTHFGRIYKMANAQFSCIGGGAAPGAHSFTIDSFHPSGQGIEGRMNGPVGGGCVVSLRFAAVVNN